MVHYWSTFAMLLYHTTSYMAIPVLFVQSGLKLVASFLTPCYNRRWKSNNLSREYNAPMVKRILWLAYWN